MTVYTIRVVYKSGYTHDLDVTEFYVKGGSYEWTAYDAAHSPLILGGNEIAAIWQIGVREEHSLEQRPENI